ncbi:MAG TPA: SulP family inorganic anion transporter [Actinotalea caeni]|uniref:SulP family inorganic anion transporter n=1 Tax=Actinotalea caeni TaxID=1348467 RepID=UPI0012E0F834|nr:SulP family inorganic anion transporter [Actinotalea caeni]HLV56978.1 SulP family inorganic anion transporter [Actinotalea caeni]
MTAATTRAAGLARLLPGRDDYRGLRESWGVDLVAGVTVGIVALPLALAFGISAGAGAESGLVTAIVAGLVAAVFGGSHVQVSGPTGAMVVVLAPILAAHGPGSLALVCLAAGVLVALAGVLRLGRTVGLIPWPVIEGFTLGIATIIFCQQIPAALATTAPAGQNALVAALGAVGGAGPAETAAALAMVAIVVAVMVLGPRLAPRFPASVVGIVVATLVAVVAGLPVATIGELPAGLPAPVLPDVDLGLLRELAGPVVAVAALAAIESLLSARVASSMTDAGGYDADRELVGQGLASVASGLFGGMPATGAIARTAVNVRSGARTRLAAITHALVLLAVVLVGARVVGQIPLAALAGVLLVTATRMVSWRSVVQVLRTSRSDALVFVLTALVTISVDLVYAVVIGIAVAAVLALRSLSRASGVHREELPGPVADGDDRIALFRLEGALFFGTAERLLDRVAATEGVEVVILRMSQLQLLDATGAQVMADMITALDRRGVTVLVKGVQAHHLLVAGRAGMIAALRHPRHLFDDLADAVEHARSHVRRAAAAREVEVPSAS